MARTRRPGPLVGVITFRGARLSVPARHQTGRPCRFGFTKWTPRQASVRFALCLIREREPRSRHHKPLLRDGEHALVVVVHRHLLCRGEAKGRLAAIVCCFGLPLPRHGRTLAHVAASQARRQGTCGVECACPLLCSWWVRGW